MCCVGKGREQMPSSRKEVSLEDFSPQVKNKNKIFFSENKS